MPIQSRLKSFLKSITGGSPEHAAYSYSADGEDIILQKILAGDSGFFAEVGAQRAGKYSHTRVFYLKGWEGISLNPAAGTITLYRQASAEDKGRGTGTINPDGRLELHETKETGFVNLAAVFGAYSGGRDIDFLTIEAADGHVLLPGNDWQLYRPKVIVAENLLTPGQERADDYKITPVHRILAGNAYRMLCKTAASVFYVDSRQL